MMCLSVGEKRCGRRWGMNNIFTSLIGMLSTIRVSGEADIGMMKNVFDLLRQMEAAANESENTEVNNG